MASVHVYDSLKSHLQAEFSPVPVMDYDQIEDYLQGEDPFIVLEEAAATDDLVAFGDTQALQNLETGTLACLYFTRAPESSGTARSLAEQIRDAMRDQVINGVRIEGVTPPTLEEMNNGRWTVGAVVLSFEYDFFTALPT